VREAVRAAPLTGTRFHPSSALSPERVEEVAALSVIKARRREDAQASQLAYTGVTL
jgi:hypothetical protein